MPLDNPPSTFCHICAAHHEVAGCVPLRYGGKCLWEVKAAYEYTNDMIKLGRFKGKNPFYELLKEGRGRIPL
jgi:hypothetical protein